jgi:hypothetical protein
LDLSSLVNVDDIDPSNELISDVTLVNGNTLTINEGPNTHELDLSGLVNVDDIDPANELISDVTLVNGNTLTINEGPNTHELDLSGLVNVDDVDPANELISDVTLVNGNTLTINEGPNTHELDLSGLVNVEDIDPTNELQTLSEVIAYSNPQGSAGAQRITDLSNPLDAQDAATKSYVDDFDLTGDLDQTLDNPRVVGLQNRPVAATAPVDGQVLVYNQVAGAWQPHTLPPSPLSGDQYYSFDISAFEETKKDGDADKTNMVTFDGAPEYLTIHKGDLGNVFIAPIHLQNGAKITEIKYSYKKRQWGHNLRFRLMRYEPATGAFAIISSWTTNFLPTSENIQTYTQDVTLNPEGLRTVDNSKYTYRLELLFNIGSASYDDMSDVQLMFYGAIMKYSL